MGEGKVGIWNLTTEQFRAWRLAGRVTFVISEGFDENHSIIKIKNMRQRMHKRASVVEKLNPKRRSKLRTISAGIHFGKSLGFISSS